jgi:hypothetical protein
MAKLVLTDVRSGTNAAATINYNNELIEEAFENTLSRDGTSPNGMETDLNMNSRRIINLAAPVHPNDAVRFVDLPAPGGGGGGGGLTDGSYDEIVVTGGGSVMTIAADVATAAGRAIMGAATVADQRSALELGSAAQSPTSAFEPTGAVAAHAGLSDPHPGYSTTAETAAAISAHVGLSSPHSQYQLTALKGQVGGYAGLDNINGKVVIGQLATGTPDGTKFLRDDGVWGVVPGAGSSGFTECGGSQLFDYFETVGAGAQEVVFTAVPASNLGNATFATNGIIVTPGVTCKYEVTVSVVAYRISGSSHGLLRYSRNGVWQIASVDCAITTADYTVGTVYTFTVMTAGIASGTRFGISITPGTGTIFGLTGALMVKRISNS